MNVFLVLVCVVIAVMVLIGSFYVLVYFQSEDDKNTAVSPKVAVVLGLTLMFLLVLMLPLDVANRASDGGLSMGLLWQIVYMLVAVMCIGVIPFMMFYYESEDPESHNWQVWIAVKYEAGTILIVGVAIVLMWLFLGFANVPLLVYSYNVTLIDSSLAVTCAAAGVPCARSPADTVLRVSVTPVVYLTALVAFVGWFLFVVFVGAGLAALPMDLLRDYCSRPQSIDLEEYGLVLIFSITRSFESFRALPFTHLWHGRYAKQKMLLNERTLKLIEVARKLGSDAHRRRDRKTARTYNKFKQAVYFLDRDWDKVKTAYKERGGNPLGWVFTAFLGGLAVALSITWYAHIVLYVFISPPSALFLNSFFITLDGVLPLFGTATYGIFSFYLLACVLKGCMKVGLRFFWIPIHPMRIGATLMNSMLFNVWLLLLCAVAAVQFCYTTFQSYAQMTAVDLLLGVQVRNLVFLSWFFYHNFFFYAMAAISALTLCFLCIFPHDTPALDDDDN